EVSVGLFDVNAIQAVANEIRSFQGDLDSFSRRELYRNGFEVAVSVVSLLRPVNDLPVAGGHVVLAGKQRSLIENTDTPVERRGQELLRDQQFRLGKVLFQPLMQVLFDLNFNDPLREGTVRFLEDA